MTLSLHQSLHVNSKHLVNVTENLSTSFPSKAGIFIFLDFSVWSPLPSSDHSVKPMLSLQLSFSRSQAFRLRGTNGDSAGGDAYVAMCSYAGSFL